jgi:multiple sugar transport system permease protein
MLDQVAALNRRKTQDRGAASLAPRRSLNREQLQLLLLAPATLLVLSLIAWPILITVELSLHDIRLFDILRGRTGDLTLDNYRFVLTDYQFHAALGRTVYYVVVSTAIAFVWGMATALVLNRAFPGRTAARLVIISPWVVPSAIGSLVWMFLFDGHLGLVNYVLLAIGAIDRPITFLVDRHWSMWAVIIASVWKSYPFFTIMLLAGLQAIPSQYYEAARIDGAPRWRQFFDITLPALRNIMAIAIFLSLLASFREVETILVMTGGGPARATETLSLMIYNETFQAYRAGRGAALGVIAFLISYVMMVFGFRRMMKDFF